MIKNIVRALIVSSCIFAASVYAKSKQDIVYGITLNASQSKEKKLTSISGEHIITVTPDNGGIITCSLFIDSHYIEENSEVNKCEFKHTSKNSENIIVKISNVGSSFIGIELRHLIK